MTVDSILIFNLNIVVLQILLERERKKNTLDNKPKLQNSENSSFVFLIVIISIL